MRSHPGVSATFFSALADAGVNVEMISTSEIRISVVCRDTDLDTAVRAVHDAFELGSGDDEAVVTEAPADERQRDERSREAALVPLRGQQRERRVALTTGPSEASGSGGSAMTELG